MLKLAHTSASLALSRSQVAWLKLCWPPRHWPERHLHQQEWQQCLPTALRYQGIHISTLGYGKNFKENLLKAEEAHITSFGSTERSGQGGFAVSTSTLKTGLKAANLKIAIRWEPPKHPLLLMHVTPPPEACGLLGDTQMYAHLFPACKGKTTVYLRRTV